MTLPAALFLICTAFVTACISGVFGMAGGLVLMGALAFVMPVSAAFVTHGILQFASNSWRAVLHRRHVRWGIVVGYAAGSLVAALAVSLVAATPSKPVLYLLLGLLPVTAWLPTRWINLDASRPAQGVLSGVCVTGVNLTAGVAGPLLDIFFVRTALGRHQIVATKAATQVFAHLSKVIVYGAPLLTNGKTGGLPPPWLFAIAIPLSLAGTLAGGRILDRMNDVDFRRWTRWLVTGVGVFYLAQAAQLFLAG
ncbi:TSUP family transporter [Phenylobacterium sp.]|uniref:TSUP family transporter n=1 Tax=Phenylobacterium sp. TaxID=1871053 RepID=UPI00378402CF